MTQKDTRYRDLLARELAMNEQTLAALGGFGLSPNPTGARSARPGG